jgi:hypothetical protein
MSNYGQLIYGFVYSDDTKPLFDAIIAKRTKEEREQAYGIELLEVDLQIKHNVSLEDAIDSYPMHAYAFQVSAPSNSFRAITAEDLAKTEEYDGRIKAFFNALGIDVSGYKPGWFVG